MFCREGYESAEGVLAHLDNVGALLSEMLNMAISPAWSCMVSQRNWKN